MPYKSFLSLPSTIVQNRCSPFVFALSLIHIYYNELFRRRNEIKTRQCVYISRDVHGKILRIVNDTADIDTLAGLYLVAAQE